MAKKKVTQGTLSNEHKKYISKYRKKGVDWLFEKINKSKIHIEKYVKHLEEIELAASQLIIKEREFVEKIEREKSSIDVSELFGRNKKYGAVVMTPAASDMGSGKITDRPSVYGKNVQKIKKDKE